MFGYFVMGIQFIQANITYIFTFILHSSHFVSYTMLVLCWLQFLFFHIDMMASHS